MPRSALPADSAASDALANRLAFVPVHEFGPDSMVALAYEATAGMPESEGPRIAQVRLRDIEARNPLSVILADGAPIGWYGWLPSASMANAWESTTFFVPAARGTGLFDLTQCRLAHEAADLRHIHGPDTRFFSAIAQWNTRSQSAFRSYAARHGWPQAWSTIHEPAKDRTSVILDWPHPAAHTCHLPVSVDAFEQYA